MNWLTNIIRPRIRSLVEQQKEMPDNLWQKCPSCEGMLFHRDLEQNHNVCMHCDFHLRISVKNRLELMFDDGKYETIALPDVAHDPLKFKDRKRYADRLKDSRAKTGLKDAITVAKGTIGGKPAVIAAFNFSFMGGSMGAAVGEGIVTAAKEALNNNAAFITVPSSGGARMQEGMLSLMQMPRSIIAVEMVKDAGLPYIVLLTNPTTGGVSASFAMVGDIHLAEPGATIGFAGRRVIEETVRETLPDDFQTAEYLQEHGIVDMVVNREELHAQLAQILNLLMHDNKDSSSKNRYSKEKPPKTKNSKATKSKNTKSKASKVTSLNKKSVVKDTFTNTYQQTKIPANSETKKPLVKKTAAGKA